MSFREDVQSFKVYDDIQHKIIKGNGAKILKRCNAGLYSLPVHRHATKTTLKK